MLPSFFCQSVSSEGCKLVFIMPRSAKEKNEAAVQGTNDSSIISKCSVCTQGYFKDDFLKHMVARQTRRAPLINRGYYIRAKAIDSSLRHFLKTFKGQTVQIVSLGAGFDAAYFRLQDAGLLADAHFVEIDFPEVVSRKASTICSTDCLSHHLGEPVFHHEDPIVKQHGGVFISSNNYHLLGVNLDDLESFHYFMMHCGCDLDKPTLFLSECVITYMDVKRSDALIEFCAKNFQNAVFVCYEQIIPNDPFGLVMMNHFRKLGSPLKAIINYPTLRDQQERYLKKGWKETQVIDMNEFYFSLGEDERGRIEMLEPFDEFEEWHLKCNHYILVLASKGSCGQVFQTFMPDREKLDDSDKVSSTCCLQVKRGLETDSGRTISCFGQGGDYSLDTGILICGGFGDQDGCHQRLNRLQVLDADTADISAVQGEEVTVSPGPRMHHTITSIGNSDFVVFGGRTSPTKPCQQTLLLSLKRGLDMTWTYMSKVISAGDICPPPRWRHSATFIKQNSKEGVFIFGGKDVGSVFSDCYLWNCNDYSWEEVSAVGGIPEARHSHTANLWEDSLVVACGLGKDSRPLHSIHLLDLVSWTWKGFDTFPVIKPRYSHSASIHQGHLLLVGGVYLHGNVLPAITKINLITGAWKEFSLVRDYPEQPLMLHNHISFIHKDTLLILGGGGNCFSFGTHLNASPVSVCLDWKNSLVEKNDITKS